MFPKKLKLLLTFIFSLFCLFFLHSSTTYAQSSSLYGIGTLGIAKLVETPVKNIKDGSVMTNSPQGAILSNTPSDPQVLGVVSHNAAILINDTTNSGTIPVISNGTVYIFVSSQQGSIKKGDLITTSTIPGVAVKAVNSGYVLGTALENYNDPNPTKAGLIVADLNLQYFNTKPSFVGSLTDIFKFALLPSSSSPSAIYKYIVAAAVVLASFILAFMTFGRTAAKGVEALGRNPAASTTIHLGIIFNVLIVIVIVLAGLTVAFMILRL